MLKVVSLSLIGGYLFSLLHIPIPWMLGPIVFLIITQLFYKGPLKWSGHFRDIGIVIVGTVIGMQFNITYLSSLGSFLFYMIALNVILIGGSIGIAFFISKWTHLPLKAAILGAIPGGLGQIITFAEEEKVKEVGIISYFQVLRLLLVVLFVPFIVAGQVIDKPASSGHFSISLIGCFALAWICSYFANRLHLSVAFFITPILLFIIIQLTTPMAMPAIPDIVMNTAQLLIGAHIGLMLKPDMLKIPTRILIGGMISSVALILLTVGSSFLMAFTLDTRFATSFLSTAPGGLDQMVLLADAIHADVSLVSIFQTFRLLFIFILVLPLMKLFYRRREKKEHSVIKAAM